MSPRRPGAGPRRLRQLAVVMTRPIAMLVIVAFAPAVARAQKVSLSVDCKADRLDRAERETCASSDLIRLTAAVDSATSQLETDLTGEDREALLDTEGPLRRQRNDCQNDAHSVHECVERILEARMNALEAASRASESIRAETGRYTFLDVAFVRRWGGRLLGRRVDVWGCMALEPGPTPATRTRGFIRQTCSKSDDRQLPVVFQSMTTERASFYDARKPTGYWAGTIDRRDGEVILLVDP